MSVAVILTCYNEGAYVEAALASVLAQTAIGAVSEIVLADDGSGAETQAVLDRLEGRDGRLRIVRGPGGWGCAGARNRALAMTTAPRLAFLDADDTWLPQKLARQLAALDADAAVDLVYTGYEALADGAETGVVTRVYDLSAYGHPARRYFLLDASIMPSSLLVRRAPFEAVGGFDAAVAMFEDTDFYLRLAQVGVLKGLPEPLIRKRFRLGSMSAARPELMAHHAFVAFRAAARDPSLTALVPRRLAERAAKLGLAAYYGGAMEVARRQAVLATTLQPLNPRALMLTALVTGGAPLRRLLARRLRARSRLHAG